MKISLDCFPCFLRQTLEASRISTSDVGMQREILHGVMDSLKELSDESTPPEMGWQVHRIIREITGNLDPYEAIKRDHNERVLHIEAELTAMVDGSSSTLMNAVKLAGRGNLIDMGPLRQWSDVADIFTGFMNQESPVFDYVPFEASLGRAERLLYIGDNAGEIVLDKILLRQLGVYPNLDITFAVRGKPIINDATMADAEAVGMTDIVTVIDTGADFPGVVLESSSEEFLTHYHHADMILAKGQGNYESLSDRREPLFFLLQAKCPVIADKIGCRVGDLVLQKGRHQSQAL